MISNCWYNDICSRDNHIVDSYGNCMKLSVCPKYLEMSHMMSKSGIPEVKQKPIPLTCEHIDQKAFTRLADVKDNIVEFVRNGHNLYLCSTNTGNGKTSWSLKLLMKYFEQVWEGNGFKTRGVFISVPSFLLRCKDFDNKDAEFDHLKKILSYVDLVVWDDLGSDILSKYDLSLLTSYLDYRSLSEKANIFTSNITTRDELQQLVGDRLTSRIWNASEVIEFKGHDRRR